MHYLDHAATTPVLPEAVTAVTAALGEVGNPSSLHAAGRTARRRVEEARESTAAALGARPSEIVLTAGGTESDNLAVKGVYWARRAADPRRNRVIISAVEHHAVLDTAQWLADEQGAEVVVLPVDPAGRIGPDTLRAAIAESADTVAVVSVMWANNEVGTVQPIAELAAVAHEFDVPLHTDAVQAVAALDVDFAASGAHAMSVTGHKLGAPVGTGALLLRRDLACTPVLHGGGQERDVRSGTLDVAGAIGFATAVTHAVAHRAETARRLDALRTELVDGIQAEVRDVVVNGHPTARLPGLAHLTFPGCEGDALLMLLDAAGVQCSTGSACAAGVSQPSHVLLAMGADAASARGSLRFSLGHTSTVDDVRAAVAAIGPAVERARRASLTASVPR